MAVQVLICQSAEQQVRAAALFPKLEARYVNGGDWQSIEGRRCVCLGEDLAAFAVGFAAEVKFLPAEIPTDLTELTALAWAKANAKLYSNPAPAVDAAPPPSSGAEASGEVAASERIPPLPGPTPAGTADAPPQEAGLPEPIPPPKVRKAAKRLQEAIRQPPALMAEVGPYQGQDIGKPASNAPDWLVILERTKAGVLNNLDNVVRVIENDPDIRGHIWYDEFLDNIVSDWQGPARGWRDSDDVLLQLYVQRHVGLQKISVNTVHDAALVAAFRNIRNECREWLESLQWDQTERLAHVLADAFGAEQCSYAQAVGRCWFISMVARVMEPGCKVDTVPVLEGAQGVGKSSALKIIGGKWFAECHESVLTKDWYGVLDGHMLVEISEMHSFTRGEVERVKGLISCQVDRYRKAYGRNTEDHPRQSVLVCTTNRDDWQRDDTGARRFWPVLCGAIDQGWLVNNREQLFAEAVQLYREGVAWWTGMEADHGEEVEKRRDADTWEPVVHDWLRGRDKVTSAEVLTDCFSIEAAKHDKLYQRRVARVMRALGWVQRVAKDRGVNRRVWELPRE